ncbi:hypothetical protein D3C79_685290 [compost metagenome]
MPLDFRSALPDALDTRVAPNALNRPFVHQAHAAEDLHGFVGDLAQHFAGKQLGHAGLTVGHVALVHLPGGVQGEHLGRADLRGHVGQLERHPLVAADGLAELLAVGGPLQ